MNLNNYYLSPSFEEVMSDAFIYKPARLIGTAFTAGQVAIDRYLQHSYLRRTIKEKKVVLNNANDILKLYAEYGNNIYQGTSISQTDHMCQCAQFAEKEGYDNDVIIAAFLHDIGHLLNDKAGNINNENIEHQNIAADYLLEKGFSLKVIKLISSAAQASRYFSYTYSLYNHSPYFEPLSETANKNIAKHGGVMSEDEALRFESDELYNLYLLFYTWDKNARQENKPLPNLRVYKEMMIRHLLTQTI